MIGESLEKIGLEKYSKRFEEQGVTTVTMLEILSDEDLKKIGVNKLRHRRMIMQLAEKHHATKAKERRKFKEAWVSRLRKECDRGINAKWDSREVGTKESKKLTDGFSVLAETELLESVCPRGRTFKSFCSKLHQ